MTIQEIMRALPDELEWQGEMYELIINRYGISYYPIERGSGLLREPVIDCDIETALRKFYQRYIEYYA